MSAEKKTLAQTYFDEVEELKASGLSNADAIREVATRYGKNENAVRGGIHQYKAKLAGGGAPAGARTRKAPASVDDLLAGARSNVERALTLIDREVEEAKAALEAAQSRYDAVRTNVKERKADLEEKLRALV